MQSLVHDVQIPSVTPIEVDAPIIEAFFNSFPSKSFSFEALGLRDVILNRVAQLESKAVPCTNIHGPYSESSVMSPGSGPPPFVQPKVINITHSVHTF